HIRQEVFALEQNILCQDLDDVDLDCLHVLGVEGPRVLAYARLLPPGIRGDVPSFGRVLTAATHRRRGLGIELVRRCVAEISERYPDLPIHISAQVYLQHFYERFGFNAFGPHYIEDDIEHVGMDRPSDATPDRSLTAN
ncbi:MAG: GNAT family N-acetyltransferase, partial [Planctomycetota bacterium]